MRIALDTMDVDVSSEEREVVRRKVSERVASSVFAGVQDLRLRLRQTKGALLCVAAVGFVGGDLVTSTATSDSPVEAIVDALEGLPERIDRVHRASAASATPLDGHAAVREELRRLLARA